VHAEHGVKSEISLNTI